MPRRLSIFCSALVLCAPGLSGRAAEPAPVMIDGYQEVGFDQLGSFTFTPPADGAEPPADAKALEKENGQIPEKIRNYDAKKIAVTGFMLPVKMDGGLVTEFLLMKSPMMCCFGVMPRINEWVVVKMNGKGVPSLMDTPIVFEGTLKVGAVYENGYLTGIYQLAGDKMVEGSAKL